MKGWQRVLVLFVALILINGATWGVVVENQRSGVYPIDGDSIGIPIISTVIASALVLPFLIFIGLLPGSNFVSHLCLRGMAWTACVGIVLLTLYFGAAIFAVGGAGYWSIPDHNSIALCYLMLCLALALFFVLDARWLLSNWSLNRTCATAARAG